MKPQRRTKQVYDILFAGNTGKISILVIAASFLLPPDGTGFSVCMMENLFELPCPGCGLTRSVTCVSHLEFVKAWNYHPFGLLVYPFLCVAALSAFLSGDIQRRMRICFWKRNRFAYPVYIAVITAFLLFGFVRFVGELWDGPVFFLIF
jgi:hypothetical protein